MHDGEPCHTAKYVKDWLDDCEVTYFKNWPGNSTDLNPTKRLQSSLECHLCDVGTRSVAKFMAANLCGV